MRINHYLLVIGRAAHRVGQYLVTPQFSPITVIVMLAVSAVLDPS